MDPSSPDPWDHSSGPQDRVGRVYRSPIPPVPDLPPAHVRSDLGPPAPPPDPPVPPRKSLLVAFGLAVLFGPLGMIYSTVSGAFVMVVVMTGLSLALGRSEGVAALVWPVCILWGVWAAQRRNDHHRRREQTRGR